MRANTNSLPDLSSGPVRPEDVLRDVYALRRKVIIAVYSIITFDLPLYFAFGYTWTEVAILAVIGWAIAAGAIFFVFSQIIRLRKRSSYATLLMLNVGDSGHSAEAGERALDVVRGLLQPDAAFLTMLDSEGAHTVIASHGISPELATERIQAHADVIQTAMDIHYPLEIYSRVGDIQVMLVPVVALKRPIGLLYMAGLRRNHDLADRPLLSSVGRAIGMSLDNLRQRELLLQKESRLRSVMKAAPVVVFAIDTAGVTTFMQGRGIERLGVAPEQVIGRTIDDVYSNYPQIVQGFRRAFAGEEVTSIATIETATARVVFEYRLAPDRDEKGRVVGLIGVATDITERKLAEDAFHESQRALETLVGNLPGFAYRCLQDVDWTVEYISAGVEEITGYAAQDFMDGAISYNDLIHPDDREAVRTSVLSATAGHTGFRMEYRIITASGEERWMWEQGQAVYSDDGEVQALEGFVNDISERKRAEHALAQSERFLATLVGNLPGFVSRMHAEPPFGLQYISPGVAEITGFTPGEVLGWTMEEYLGHIHPDDHVVVVSAIEAGARGEPFEVEFRITTKDGAERWFWEQGEAVKDDSGRPFAIEAFVMDVTERKLAERGLAESERFLSTLVANLPGFVYRCSVGPPFALQYASQGARDLLGWDPAELLGKDVAPVLDGIHPDDKERFFGVIFGSIETGEPFEVEFRAMTKSGIERRFWEQGEVIRDEVGNPVAIEAFVMDVTERKLAEEALMESEERFRDLFDNARDAVFSCDFRGRFLSANNRLLELSGYTRDELQEHTVGQLIAGELHVFTADNMRRVFNGDPSPFELEILARDGHRVPIEVTARVVFEGERPVAVQGIARDITERRQAEDTIRRLAYHDALTDLPNRALFEDRLELALAQARRSHEMVVVMFLDLDGFKVVNDTLGHSAGDRLLQSVASDLLTAVRDGDTVARVGGDEFTILLPSIERPEDATEVALRIIETLEQPRIIDGQEFRTTGSIGITTYPEDGDDPGTLLRNADTAMYRAKESGRDNFQLYTPAMNARILERLAFESDLRKALKRDEFRIYYQPIVNVESGEVTGAEALVRWAHPTRGLILPDEFVPFAEESGLIIDIGESVLRGACRQLREWLDTGVTIGRMAVNLSARQLQQEDIVERIAAVLNDTRVPPELIQLEITEGAVLKNVDHITAALVELRSMGMGVSLDDFGTGYSSLTYLKRFPIDAVKIDRSFVRDLETDASDATIVSTVIAMADNLHLKVIAEGVETQPQLDFLKSRGCDEFQGYLVSPPVPADAFRALLLAREVRRPMKNGANGNLSAPHARRRL